MSQQYENGYAAFLNGYARHANPVAYIVDGVPFSVQAKLRDDWFAGWDAAQAAE